MDLDLTDLTLDDLDLPRLPRMAQELIRAIGLQLTIKLTRDLAGSRQYMKPKIDDDHAIIKSVGEQAYRKLLEEWQYDTIEMPKVDSIETQARLLLTIKLWQAGRTYAEIGMAVNRTHSWVNRTIKHYRENSHKKSHDVPSYLLEVSKGDNYAMFDTVLEDEA